MNNFPPELLELIFSYLQDHYQNRLGECMQVCKLWYSIASKKKYGIIMAYPIHAQSMQKYQRTRIDGKKPLDFIQSCRFGCWRFNRHDFQELMRNLPNLRELQDIPQRCLPFLNNEDILGHLTRLKKIEIMNADSLWAADLYFEINVKLKNQITWLTLVPSSMDAWKGRYKELLTTLSGFRILQNLRIYSCNEKGTGVIHLTSILNACNNLISLNLSNQSIWNINKANDVIHTSLTSLKLYVSDLTENHLEYMMRNLPNLRYFTLDLYNNTFEGVMTTANPDIANRFTMYLKKMKHLKLLRRDSDLSNESGSSRPLEDLIFWKFLRDICDEDCFCDLNVCVISQAESTRIPRFEKQNRNVFLKCDIMLDSSNYANWLQKFDLLTFRSIKLYSNQNNRDEMQPPGYSFNNWILQPLITRLKQQQQQQICRFDVEHMAHKVVFSESFLGRQFLEKCTMNNITLENSLLKELAHLFPFVEKFQFLHGCMIEKEDNKTTTSCIDLTQFGKAQRLMFNLYSMFPDNEPRMKTYVKFINVTKADSFECYCFNKQTRTLDNLGKQLKYETRGSHLLKIYHTGIRSITFQKFSSEFHVTLED